MHGRELAPPALAVRLIELLTRTLTEGDEHQSMEIEVIATRINGMSRDDLRIMVDALTDVAMDLSVACAEGSGGPLAPLAAVVSGRYRGWNRRKR